MSYQLQNGTMSHNPYSNERELSSKEQTLMWQQNSFMCDSGFDSGVATQQPSLLGKDDDEMEEESLMLDLDQSYTQQTSIPEQQQKSEPIKEILSVQIPLESPQLLERVQDNQFYQQDEAVLTARAIPQLIKLLNDEDQVVVSQAAMMVHQLSRKEATNIMNSPQLVAALVRAMAISDDLETTKGAVGTLHYLSHHKQGSLAIFRTGGVPALVKLLSSTVEAILFYAITTLHNLLLHQDDSKTAVRLAGGLEKIVLLLQRNNVSFLSIVTDCLHILANGHSESKMKILECAGPSQLVRIMITYTKDTKLLYTTSKLLKVLSVCSSNKLAIVQAGGMQALAMHLGSSYHRLVHNCLWALRNLSDAATKLDGLENVLNSLVQILGSNDSEVVTCAAGIISNLTCNNQRNKTTVCQVGGIDALIRIINNAGDREQITEPAICALRHVTINHDESLHAQNSVRLNYGLPVIVKLLNPSSGWPLIKAVIGLIRNLALCSENHAPLRELGTILQLVRLLITSVQDIARPRSTTGGVRMEEIIEVTVGALYRLAGENYNRMIIRQQAVIPILLQLLFNGVENIQRVSLRVLFELAGDEDGAVLIEQEGGAVHLTELLKSSNENLATSADEVLSRMREFKSQEYKKQLSAELTSSLFPDENNLWNGDLGLGPDLQDMLNSDQAYEGLYGHGPPSVHSSHGGSGFQQAFETVPVESMECLEIGGRGQSNLLGQPKSPYAMDMDVGEIGAGELSFDNLDSMPSPQDNSWYNQR